MGLGLGRVGVEGAAGGVEPVLDPPLLVEPPEEEPLVLEPVEPPEGAVVLLLFAGGEASGAKGSRVGPWL